MKRFKKCSVRVAAALVLVLSLLVEILTPIGTTSVFAAGFSGYTPISSAQDLADIVNDKEGKYYLTKDIDMGTYGLWKPISGFTGTLDGNGKKIKNLKITSAENGYSGLFGAMNGATVKNLTVQVTIDINSDDETTYYIGGIAGATSGCKLSNCKVAGEITLSRKKQTILSHSESNQGVRSTIIETSYVGGILGLAVDSKMEKCCNDADITVTGDFNVTVENTSPQIDEFTCVGGIAGWASGTYKKLINDGTITVSVSDSTYHWAGQLKKAYIVGYSYAGGLFGLLSGEAGNVQNVGAVTLSSAVSCTADSQNRKEYYTITHNANCGGIAGDLNGKLLYACNSGRVLGSGAGAIAGYADTDAFCNYAYFLDETGSTLGVYDGSVSACTTKALNNSGFQKQTFFKGLDFDKVWTVEKGINNGYPFLASFKSVFQLPQVTADKKNGTYKKEVVVKLSSPVKDAKIYYTTNGTKPTTKSKLYKGPLTFKKDTVLKVVVVKSKYKSSKVSTFKYKIKKK